MRRLESLKRVCVLWLSLAGLLLETAVYAYIWFRNYYPIVNRFNLGLKFFFKGHLLIIAIYFVLLFFFTSTYGGLKIGYLKPGDVFLSQLVSLCIVDVITYFQISLMSNRLVPVVYFAQALVLQLLISGIWTAFCNRVYRRVFPPREMLLVHGHRSIEDILRKFESRRDKYRITKCVNIKEGIWKIQEEIDSGFHAVVLWDISTEDRNKLLKYCYSRSVRVYMMPKIPDVLIAGADQLHLFDTPIFLTREYALTVEQRMAKRMIDLVLSLVLTILTSPIMLITAICIKCYDGGPILYKQTRCTCGGREFRIMKFRSMKVDAEKDGVARLSTGDKDDRITKVGHIIRACRLDELPQLLNILKGDLSVVGPRPERPEIAAQYCEEMPEFALRLQAKAGLTGYAQVYGKYNTTPYDKLQMDLMYIAHPSLIEDLKIMLATVKILFMPESTEGVSEGQTTAMSGENN